MGMSRPGVHARPTLKPQGPFPPVPFHTSCSSSSPIASVATTPRQPLPVVRSSARRGSTKPPCSSTQVTKRSHSGHTRVRGAEIGDVGVPGRPGAAPCCGACGGGGGRGCRGQGVGGCEKAHACRVVQDAGTGKGQGLGFRV
eukprot:364700-Chlamydomonas_euryale.AAC.8